MLPHYNTPTMNNNSNRNESNLDGMKIRVKSLHIGKVTNLVSFVEFQSDRIVFANIENEITRNKYNVTLPYAEITALRYCFMGEIHLIAIQPIHESFFKFAQWLKLTTTVPVPENFIMIRFIEPLKRFQLNVLRISALDCKSSIKIIEINQLHARNYLNTPNRSMNRFFSSGSNIKSCHSPYIIRRLIKEEPKEIIHLDDDDDGENGNNKLDELKKDSMLDQPILRYPKDESKPIILYGNDLNCLAEGQYLNDNIMNFYLKYFQYNGNLSENILEKIHIYDALFATHMFSFGTRKRKYVSNNMIVTTQENPLLTAYETVLKKWTKDIDIFAKDFLFIPLVKDSHWFLIILCYIGNLITEQNGTVLSQNQMMKRPTVIFMDSLVNNINRGDICRSLMTYLSLELNNKRSIQKNSVTFNYKCLIPKVPQQSNSYDCGLFVLEYIERFLKSPEEIFLTLVNDNSSLQNWFDPRTLNTKRSKIQQIILNLLPPDNAKKLEQELTQVQLDSFNENNDQQSMASPSYL